MSADSQRSRSMASSVESGGSSAVRCMPTIVPPQAVSDRSIIDSVAGFINDVTLQAQAPLGDSKDHILWVRFENAADISDPCLGDDWELEGGIAPPLLLILGYVSGVQVWIVPANGEAIEVLSWRHGSVKCLRVLPTPTSGDRETAAESTDHFTHKRPLIALCDSGLGGASASAAAANGSYQYCAVNFISLKDGETVKSIKFKSMIVDILANRSSIVVTFPERIAVFDARTLEDRLTVTTCHPSPGLNPNPVALGSRWIAYAERRLIPSKRSSGGCEGDGVTSYTATVLNAAKSFGKGLRELGEQVAAGLTGSHLGSSLGSTLVGGGSGSSSGGVGGGMTSGSNTGSANDVSILSGGGTVSEGNQPGIVTVLDIKHPVKDVSPTTGTPVTSNGSDPIVAHFLAHSEAIVALAFDAPGMLLLTADKRGHDFHVFRLHPHPSGASLAAVHHLYVLHRGDTTAKVQDVAFSLDSRWVAVSTLRGTTHVFPVTPYGGPAGVRTHGSPHVVNRLSRFHRSAGLSIDGRSSSPVSHSGEGGTGANHVPTAMAYANPRTPPFPHPTIVQPLAQLRQPSNLLGSGGGSNIGVGGGGGSASSKTMGGAHHGHHTRQRNSSSSSSDDLMKPLRVCASFAKARSWLLDPPGCVVRDTPAHRIQRKPIDSLFIMAAHGALIQYDLEPKHASGTPKEKICDDTPIELEVEAKAQWCLQRQENSSTGDIQPPLSLDNWLIKDRFIEEGVAGGRSDSGSMQDYDRLLHSHHRGSTGNISVDHDDRWLSQVEIITHAGPHRRLWMGPQFMFKTYNTPSGSPLSSIDTEAVEICTGSGSGNVFNRSLQRSNPMNMPLVGGSYEQSPRMMNMNEFRHHENLDTEFSSLGPVESQLREDLADAMRESPLIATGKDTTGNLAGSSGTACGGSGTGGTGGQPSQQHHPSAVANQHALNSATGLSSVSSCSSTSIYSSTHSLSSICDQQHQQVHHQQQQHQFGGGGGCKVSGGSNEGDASGCFFECKQPPMFASSGDSSNKASGLVKKNVGIVHTTVQHQQQLHQHNYYPDPSRPDSGASGRNIYPGGGITIAKVVNPLGTVTTISTVGGGSAGPESIDSDDFMQECVESYLHENCDEALFRPVVTVHHESVSAGNLPSQELDMVEMRSGRYRGSSLDRTGGNGVETTGKGRLMAGGCEERPLSQPASLIGRDLIVPVIEEKNMPYFTSSGAKKQHTKHLTEQEVTQRPDAQGESTVQQVPARKLSSKKDTNTDISNIGKLLKDTGVDTKGSETSTLNVTDPLKACEEFETIELPLVESEPLEKDSKVTKKEMKNVLRAESHSVTSAGSKKSKEKKVPLLLDAPSTTDRKKEVGNVRSNAVQDKKNISIPNSVSEKRGNKRTTNSQKIHSKDNKKEKESSVETKRSVVAPVLDSDHLLPPLEALKIDDLELFGDDLVHDTPLHAAESDAAKAVTTSTKQSTDVRNVKVKEESSSVEETEASLRAVKLVLDTYHDPLASDSKYEVLEFVEQSHGCAAKCADTENDEKTLISFESPLVEQAKALVDETLDGEQQKQMAVDMESVFAGGNIMLAMCSSLREASPSTEPESADASNEPSSGVGTAGQGVLKQHSLEGQDSDYKSLELDMDMQSTSGEMGNMSTSYNPTTDTTTTIVSLLSSASEDDEDVTTNSTNNDQEEEPAGDEALLEVKDTDTVHKTSEPSGKRRRRKRTITCQNSTTTSSTTINMATSDTKDEDGDEEEENGDEDDEELQPLISSNKTSSSSLSAPATTKKDSLTYGEGPLLGNETSVLLTSLPTEGEEPTVEATETTGGLSANNSTMDDSSVAAAKCSATGSGASLSTSLLATSLTGKTAGAAGGGNGGNGKKKSKKKRK
uniref:BCAS3 domain-containing protein n=1 Tax=Anopheles minimus TaxID=112268 RepID=A0A182W604_9DIPT